MTDPVDLLRKLVSISSISRESNRELIDFVEETLLAVNWTFEEHTYRDEIGLEKVNLIACPASFPRTDKYVELALVCHTDTVPYAAGWKDATRLVSHGEALKGCGACDVKGFLACLLAIAASLTATSLRKPLCMIFTADEEIGCVGARHLVDLDIVRPRYSIIGEPTSLQPMRAGKGYCLAEIRVGGREAHSAYPENGQSAIFRAARLIVEIEKIAERVRAERSEAFIPPWTTLNVGVIQGGLAKNIVAPNCEFLLEWRPVPQQHPEYVINLVREAAARLAQESTGFFCEVKVVRIQEGFATSEESRVLKAFERAGRGTTGAVAFGTEAPWLAKMGAEAVVFGPGSMQSAHSPREFVEQPELYECVAILESVIRELCG